MDGRDDFVELGLDGWDSFMASFSLIKLRVYAK